jgi:hypothetical protein
LNTFNFSLVQYNKRKRILKNINLPGQISIHKIFDIIGFIGIISNGFTNAFIKIVKVHKIFAGIELNEKVRIYTSDPKFIKAVLIKDFSSFVNRDVLNFIFYIYLKLH